MRKARFIGAGTYSTAVIQLDKAEQCSWGPLEAAPALALGISQAGTWAHGWALLIEVPWLGRAELWGAGDSGIAGAEAEEPRG